MPNQDHDWDPELGLGSMMINFTTPKVMNPLTNAMKYTNEGHVKLTFDWHAGDCRGHGCIHGHGYDHGMVQS